MRGIHCTLLQCKRKVYSFNISVGNILSVNLGKRGRTVGAPVGDTKLELERELERMKLWCASHLYAVIRAPDGKIKGAPIRNCCARTRYLHVSAGA